MATTIYFDMDGTIANLYSVSNWLEKLRAFDATPYAEALPMVNMALLARLLNQLKAKGYRIGIVSWLSKEPTRAYDVAVSKAKISWLKKHLKSVHFDEIHIIAHGYPKHFVVSDENGILFDDEEANRQAWMKNSDEAIAFDEKNIIAILKNLL